MEQWVISSRGAAERAEVVRKMRILHCIPSLGGGGAERQVTYIADALVREAWEVHVAYLQSGANLERLRRSGAILHPIKSRGNYDPAIFWRLVGTIRRVEPKVVQTWIPQMDVLGGLAAIFTGVPFILSERSCSLAYGRGWKERLRRLVARRAAAVVANSENGGKYWEAMNHSRPVRVIRNGVPFSEVDRAVAEETAGIQEPLEMVLFAGRYSPEKNLMTLLQAVPEVLAVKTDAVFYLFGEGPLERELVAAVARRGLRGGVRIQGFTSQLWGWMKRARAFVSLSLFEGSSNVVLEAAAAGCPLVLSDIAANRELFDDDAAFFVDPSDAGAVARAVIAALGDRGKAEQKARRAHERLWRWSVEAVASEYLDLYREVLPSARW